MNLTYLRKTIQRQTKTSAVPRLQSKDDTAFRREFLKAKRDGLGIGGKFTKFFGDLVTDAAKYCQDLIIGA